MTVSYSSKVGPLQNGVVLHTHKNLTLTKYMLLNEDAHAKHHDIHLQHSSYFKFFILEWTKTMVLVH